jgi:erythromycin esterase
VRLRIVGTKCVALVLTPLAFAAHAAGQSAAVSSSFTQWVRANAVALPSVDSPYADSSFDFLRSLVGDARILSLGEVIHRGHQPLEFRNEVIKYAVSHLGFTAVAIESGFTESAAVDSFIHGGAGDVDSIMRAGITWNFGTLPENRELVLWLREYNAHAARPVHFYGFDMTGADPANLADFYFGAPLAVRAALNYLQEVAPSSAADVKSDLDPLMNRFTPYGYAEYSVEERTRLRAGLRKLAHVLAVDSSRYVGASSPSSYAWAARNAWMALRLDELLAMGVSTSPPIERARTVFRDSLMAEDIRWILRTEGDGGRVVVFAHNAHLMNVPQHAFEVQPGKGIVPVGAPVRMCGQYLRAWFGAKEVVVGSDAASIVGWPDIPSDSSSLDATFETIGVPTFVLDLRTADRDPVVAAMLRRPWLWRFQTFFEPIAPREAVDAIVYFDRITPTKGD